MIKGKRRGIEKERKDSEKRYVMKIFNE